MRRPTRHELRDIETAARYLKKSLGPDYFRLLQMNAMRGEREAWTQAALDFWRAMREFDGSMEGVLEMSKRGAAYCGAVAAISDRFAAEIREVRGKLKSVETGRDQGAAQREDT